MSLLEQLKTKRCDLLAEIDELTGTIEAHRASVAEKETTIDWIDCLLADAEQAPAAVAETAETLVELQAEVERARHKFPDNRHLLAALTEEIGELARAYLDAEGPDRVRAEAIQVACVALRIAEEGDSAFDGCEAPDRNVVLGREHVHPADAVTALQPKGTT